MSVQFHRVEVHETNMSLNGVRLHTTIHDRSDPITDNEFAEDADFGSFMEMRDWLQ